MTFYFVEPEVAGGFGSRTEIDKTSGKMKVLKLHHEFDGWLGDELLESTPCFIGTERLMNQIKFSRLTGLQFQDVKITTSDQFKDLYPECQLPNFFWFQVVGKPGCEDFGIAKDLRLVVSEKALMVLRLCSINHALITPLEAE